MRTLCLSILATGLIACLPSFVSQNPQIPSTGQTIMSSINGLSITNITLQAREEKHLPPGTTPDSNRAIGFATVFVKLENHTNENVELIIESIEIRNTSNNRVQIATASPQTIRLRPLEYSEEVFQLTNQSGYSRGDRVKAVITYEVGEYVGTIESAPTKIERF